MYEPVSLRRRYGMSREGAARAAVESGNCVRRARRARFLAMADFPIERAEVVALLFNVSDIARTLTSIERLLGEDDGEEEADEG
jgi:hypothetical protein